MMRTILDRLERQDAYVIVGIGGDSGSGKTTFSNGIRKLLGDDMVSGFSMDDYHKEDRETRKRIAHLPLDPDYNHLDLLAEHLGELRNGKEIIKPVYNHKTGEFDPQIVFHPTRIIIIEGLHPFYLPELRDKMDFKLFVDPVRDVKWKWKLQRDVEKRGHSKEDVFKEMLKREPLYKLYIDIQKIYSEVIIRIEPSRYSDDEIRNPQVKLRLLHTGMPVHHIDMTFDMANFITNSDSQFSLEFGSNYYYGNRFNLLNIDGLINKHALEKLEERINRFIGTEDKSIFEKDQETVNPTGVAQLIIVWRFLEKLNLILGEIESFRG